MLKPNDNKPIRSTPMPALPPYYGEAERANVLAALDQGNLSYLHPDGFVKKACRRVAQMVGVKHGIATSSGTAALHVAVGAAGVEAGAEIILPPITDMGTAIAILYQNAIPVFADVDPHSYNLTPESVLAAITDRTQAVIAVHLAGNPCAVDQLRDLCDARNITLIEDAAQAWGAKLHGKPVGSFGHIGCFSLNQFKHISCGDGGLIVTDDDHLAARCRNFSDKFYDRDNTGVRLTELAPNYRMTELQGAVALAQLDNVNAIAERRQMLGQLLTQQLQELPGVIVPDVQPSAFCSFWFYMFRINPQELDCRCEDMVERINELGILVHKGYIPRPLYCEPLFQNKRFFPGGVWPAELVSGRQYDYTEVHCAAAEQVLDTAIKLPLHQGMTESDVNDIAQAIGHVVRTQTPALGSTRP